ncbi:HNH endonuclease [Thauera humireducens]|uniref:HNH nuclease domain-containing protein n=1 Tax=Thauera humireducens TaxID=1134435 RepID=A0A127K5D9_9RHOO|nr:HNH endonuclease [Thauera humireducens]AMO37170.1 hypothetical protein AC731_009510 [Thauera humireducens]
MRTLTVRYRETRRKVVQEKMTAFVPYGAEQFSALAPEDRHMHLIRFDQVESAFDSKTGELISLRELCGAQPLPGAPFNVHRPQSRPKGRKRSLQAKDAKQARRQDREAFLDRYGYGVIWNHFRNELISLFRGRCFACGCSGDLQLDHHIPFSAGGRREPGNIVMLCYKCNAQKWDYDPSEYYSAKELELLTGLLEEERKVIGFVFCNDRWLDDPIAYLHEIGINPLLLCEVTTNPDHQWTLVDAIARAEHLR